MYDIQVPSFSPRSGWNVDFECVVHSDSSRWTFAIKQWRFCEKKWTEERCASPEDIENAVRARRRREDQTAAARLSATVPTQTSVKGSRNKLEDSSDPPWVTLPRRLPERRPANTGPARLLPPRSRRFRTGRRVTRTCFGSGCDVIPQRVQSGRRHPHTSGRALPSGTWPVGKPRLGSGIVEEGKMKDVGGGRNANHLRITFQGRRTIFASLPREPDPGPRIGASTFWKANGGIGGCFDAVLPPSVIQSPLCTARCSRMQSIPNNHRCRPQRSGWLIDRVSVAPLVMFNALQTADGMGVHHINLAIIGTALNCAQVTDIRRLCCMACIRLSNPRAGKASIASHLPRSSPDATCWKLFFAPSTGNSTLTLATSCIAVNFVVGLELIRNEGGVRLTIKQEPFNQCLDNNGLAPQNTALANDPEQSDLGWTGVISGPYPGSRSIDRGGRETGCKGRQLCPRAKDTGPHPEALFRHITGVPWLDANRAPGKHIKVVCLWEHGGKLAPPCATLRACTIAVVWGTCAHAVRCDHPPRRPPNLAIPPYASAATYASHTRMRHAWKHQI
ncbi:hypothetical protein BD413DRAFT_680303 [Trametes elegans]|nr:hypothetical protein BD413DRAFT_680303 [Trametes elegans]